MLIMVGPAVVFCHFQRNRPTATVDLNGCIHSDLFVKFINGSAT